MSHFIPTNESIDAENLALLYLREIFRLHGLPTTIVSDRGPAFVSQFLRRLMGLLGVELHAGTAYHPQSDGQTERVNQFLEAYLRNFISYHQDDWYDWLPHAEFCYNNLVNDSTQQTPFFANYAYHPTFLITADNTSTVPAAENLAAVIQSLHEELRFELEFAQQRSATFYNRHRTEPPSFLDGDLVLLRRRHIRTNRPSAKLDHQFLGPFQIESTPSKNARRLKLPQQYSRLYPVFNISLLEPYRRPPPAMRRPGLPGPRPTVLIDEDTTIRHPSQILDCRLVGRRYDYLVQYHNLPSSENSWMSLASLASGADSLIRMFHTRNPTKPCPEQFRDAILPRIPTTRERRRIGLP